MRKKQQNLQKMDKPLFSYWQALTMAFYSRRLFIDVAKRWRGYGLLYLLFVISIACIPLSVRISNQFNQYFNEEMILPLENLPVLNIKNGNVMFDKPMPYFVKNKAGKQVVMIDTTGAINQMSTLYPDLTILITKNRIFFRPPKFKLFLTKLDDLKGNKIYSQALSEESNETFVGKDWVMSSGIIKVKWLAAAFVYPVMLAFSFGVDVGIMLFLAFIGQLLSIVVFKFKMTFKMSCRLFLVAATSQLILFFMLLAANISPPGGGFFYLAWLCVYFSYAALAVKRESNQLVLT